MNILKKYAFWIAAALTLLACLYAYFQFLLPLDVFLWDESHHGFYSLQIYNDLKAGDWALFWVHTNHQALWMPLHSWISGASLYLFGFSYTAARGSSLFLFFCCSIFLFLIGQELSKEKGWGIGLLAVSLFLTSPILLSLATLNMQEMLGTFVLLVLVYYMVKLMSLETAWKYLCIGLLISIAYWSKSNFAIQLILGVGLFQLSLLWGLNKREPAIKPPSPASTKDSHPLPEGEGRCAVAFYPLALWERGCELFHVGGGEGCEWLLKKNAKKSKKTKADSNLFSYLAVKFKDNNLLAWCIDNTLIIAGFLPLFILWWATPPFERKYALGFIFRTQGIGEALFYPSVNFFGRIVFYLQSLISSYNFSLWLGLGCLAALGGAFYYFNDKKIRLISFIFLSNLFMVSLVGNIQERYISTAAPLVFTLLAYFIVMFIGKLREQKKAKSLIYALILIFAAVILYDALSLTRYTKEVANRSILFFIYKDSLNHFSPPFLFGLVKRPVFTYPMEQTKKYSNFNLPTHSSLNAALNFFRQNIDKKKSISALISFAELSPYVIYWHFHDWEAPVYSANDIPMVKDNFWLADYFIDLQPSADSPYVVDWLDKGWNKFGPILLKSGYIKLVISKEMADLGLTANIYKRVKSPYE